MAFENLTLFELQLDGAQFGPKTIGSDDASDDAMETADSDGSRRLVPVLLVAVVAVGAALLYRRFRSTDTELDAESEAPESDLAAAQ